MSETGHRSSGAAPTGIRISGARCLALAVSAVFALALLLASASSASPRAPSSQTAPVATLLGALASQYRQAFPSHDPSAAARVRGLAAATRTIAAAGGSSDAGRAARLAGELDAVVSATRFPLQVWPLPDRVDALTAAIGRELRARTGRTGTAAPPARSGRAGTAAAAVEVSSLVHAAAADATAGRVGPARVALAEAYAVFASDMADGLEAVAPELVTLTEHDLSRGFEPDHSLAEDRAAAALTTDAARVAGDLHDDAAALGEVTVSHATIVGDAAIILFREGLEAVLILAAITASFTGERRRLRRPVLIGAGLGLAATAVTYVLAQAIVDALGDGGLRLRAITGLLAIGVLLVVTNWFFHRMYWSEWIARFNRRRRSLERVERLGIVSGQTLGFLILGLTSVYREGLETVLFLQNLQVSAGTAATLLGVAIGLVATLIVGVITFTLGHKLPYRRMLIVTGVLIGLVLAVMTGTTVNNLQGLGWIPSNSAGFTVDPRLSQWLGFYATWEGVVAQLGALLVVYGSYALARQIQHRRRRRAVLAGGPARERLATD